MSGSLAMVIGNSGLRDVLAAAFSSLPLVLALDLVV
jgi:hypothetical protein